MCFRVIGACNVVVEVERIGLTTTGIKGADRLYGFAGEIGDAVIYFLVPTVRINNRRII